MRSCWFNSLYTRVVPSHAVELTSAPSSGQRCGEHDLRGYLAQVNAMQRVFAALAAGG